MALVGQTSMLILLGSELVSVMLQLSEISSPWHATHGKGNPYVTEEKTHKNVSRNYTRPNIKEILPNSKSPRQTEPL